MKIIMKISLAAFFSFAILSCQGRNVQTTHQAIDTAETLMSYPVSPEIATPAPIMPVLTTPDARTVNVNFVSVLSGSLYIGPSDSGIYYELDFDRDRVIEHQLPKNCRLLSPGQKAICQVTAPGVNRLEINVYDVTTGQHDFPENKEVSRWGVSGTEDLLLYVTNQNTVLIYELETKIQKEVGNLNLNEELTIPWLSSISEGFLIGINYEQKEWMISEIPPEDETKPLVFESINISENIAATDALEWSPNQAMVALVGFDRGDKLAKMSVYQCKWIVTVYDPYKQRVISTVKAPDRQCFGGIFFHQYAVWSPNSSKVVLFPDQDMCIVDLENPEQGCFPVSIPHQVDYIIQSLNWSPDSDYIAYYYDYKFGGASGELWVYSIKENKNYLVATEEVFSSSFLGNYLFWGQ
jgi:hypothetical protein